MKKSGKLFKFVVGLLVMLLIHHFAIRPWMLSWGAPEKITTLNLSGDHFTEGRTHTRAVSIQATPEQIWPWLIQLGQERGGFYSYAWLENIFLADMRNVYAIRSELQKPRAVGDTIWLANKAHYNGKGFQIIAEIIPEKSFVMVGGDDFNRIQAEKKAVGSWSIYLYQENDTETWLIARSSDNERLGNRIVRYFTFEVPHFIMEQKMLRTIKQLVEMD